MFPRSDSTQNANGGGGLKFMQKISQYWIRLPLSPLVLLSFSLYSLFFGPFRLSKPRLTLG